MQNALRTCLRALFLWALAGAAVGLAVYHRFPQKVPAFWSGVIVGFFVWLTFAYLWAIPMNLADWWRMRSGASPRDGKRVAVIGTIHPVGSTLHSPFTKTSCVAYSYAVTSLAGESPSKDFEGFALVPSLIHTYSGQVKLLAYPDIESLPEEPTRGPEAKAAAREYIDTTEFRNVRAEGLKAISEEMKKLLLDDDGSMRYDHRMEPVAESLDQCRLTERILRPGDSVCVLGKYSEEKRALVPDEKAMLYSATIRKGSPGSFQTGALKKAFGSAIGVVICGGLVTAAALFFLVNVPMDAAEQQNPARRFSWEEVRLEHWIEKNVRMPLVQAGTITQPGMFFPELCNHCATGRLEANGHTISLDHASAWENETTRVVHLAAKEGEKDGVTITFDKTRKPLPWHELPSTITITMNGRDWNVPAEWSLPSDVQTAFNSANVVDGRVTVIGPDDNVRVRGAYRTEVEGR